MKLFRVTCRGMQDTHGTAFVVAADPTAAYRCLRVELDRRDVGFRKDRELEAVELVADDAEYPECGRRLLHAAAPEPPR